MLFNKQLVLLTLILLSNLALADGDSDLFPKFSAAVGRGDSFQDLLKIFNSERDQFNNCVDSTQTPSPLTSEEKAVICEYTKGLYSVVNSNLYHGSRDNLVLGFAVLLDEVLAKLPSTTLTVYRGSTQNFVAVAGQDQAFPAYLSTSTSEESARMFMTPPFRLLKIRTQTGRSIGRYTMNPEENEILIPRNSRFHIDNVTTESDGVQIVEITEI